MVRTKVVVLVVDDELKDGEEERKTAKRELSLNEAVATYKAVPRCLMSCRRLIAGWLGSR